ncbi:xylose isomerase domain-containing protein [Halosimplex carlsbadense 2-9-1]|uniref:Xylose isomerase domain-containing protein n=1 Tax=Halosimplex carlsbadense 2-9-1 TaxID=797114 RepID=M0D1B8_9EURY|nr:sugar phosphate isomerase/epimerase family protein [Halosimplex carlsbadense]ELZ29311.1 xylose isomerase domain-containing protein [Halosimplex carlsbadense 2-9-1]
MYTSFGLDAIGVDRPFPEAAALAAEHGFDAVQVDLGYLREVGPDDYRAVRDDHGLRSGSATLPVDVTADAETYEADLDALPEVAESVAAVGCSRMSTYIMSFSDERPFEGNFAFHRDRLEPVAAVLADHGIDLGLEFLGPERLRAGHEYDFISTADGMLDLCSAVGDNAGLLLDCWHWHTAGGSVEALEALDADDIVDVHVNDAPEGLGLDEYVDTERAMPGATGVVDIETFLSHLDAVGYDGPVMAEPFSDELEAMADADAARATAESLERVFEPAGV